MKHTQQDPTSVLQRLWGLSSLSLSVFLGSHACPCVCLFLCVSSEIQLSVPAPPCLDEVQLRWRKKKGKRWSIGASLSLTQLSVPRGRFNTVHIRWKLRQHQHKHDPSFSLFKFSMLRQSNANMCTCGNFSSTTELHYTKVTILSCWKLTYNVLYFTDFERFLIFLHYYYQNMGVSSCFADENFTFNIKDYLQYLGP